MQRQLTNPAAPPVLAGVPDAGPEHFADVDFTYVYDVSLTAGQALLNEQQPIDTDSSFQWRATLVTQATGSFQVRFFDSGGYYLSSGPIVSANFSSNPASPTPQFPEVALPPGGRIGIEIQDLSNAPNDIQIVFRGVKRYQLSANAR